MKHRRWFFEVYDLLGRLIQMRDRYRCPACRKVGTWKPHGGWWDQAMENDVRGCRRWLCKWCGFYEGPLPESQAWGVGLLCYPDPDEKVWKFRWEAESFASCRTPNDWMREHGVNPWVG